ncbi:MAG: hypothetical protein RBU30_23825, partial [Polyangia bacterium]|nr:hypothetical protein [Polyangia bacterium]
MTGSDEVEEGSPVSIPPDCPIAVYGAGVVVALPGKGTHLWSARVNDELRVRSVSSERLPSKVEGRSVVALPEQVLVGGRRAGGTWIGVAVLGRDGKVGGVEGTRGRNGGTGQAASIPAKLGRGAPPHGMPVMSEPRSSDWLPFEKLDLPADPSDAGREASDLLVAGSRVLALEGSRRAQRVLCYDLGRGGRPALGRHVACPGHYSLERVLHGAVGGGWLTLLSASEGPLGAFRHLGIYHGGTLAEIAALHFELGAGGDGSISIQATAYLFAAPIHRQTRQQSADRALPRGFLPVQIVSLESRLYLLGASGEVVSAGLGMLGPERLVGLKGLESWFRLEPVEGLRGGPPSLLVAVPLRGRVVALIRQGVTAILGNGQG